MSHSHIREILFDILQRGAADGADVPLLLCQACVREIPVDGAGISLIGDRGVEVTVAATGAEALRLEELQFTVGEGPSLDAFHAGRPVFEPDVRTTIGAVRWPGFCSVAADSGIAAVFAFPLQLGGIRLGVLDLYRMVPGALDAAQTASALAFTDSATVLLLYLQGETWPGDMPQYLATALDGRTEVHQATGIISVQAGVSLSDALVLLRASAFTSGRALSDVSADVVARTLRFHIGGVDNE